MNSEKKKQFKAQAHVLKPVIIIGQNGLTESVLKEIEITLETHELIKIKIRADREERKQICQQIVTKTQSEQIQTIGQILVIYRKKQVKN